MNQALWDKRYLNLAQTISTWSEDRSTNLGAIIVSSNNAILSVGYNGFPRGVNQHVEERHARPAKYTFTEHAERNAIYNAARNSIPIFGATLYMFSPIAGPPCGDCARGVIQSGIKRVVVHGVDNVIAAPDGSKAGDWRSTMNDAITMFEEARIYFNIVNKDS